MRMRKLPVDVSYLYSGEFIKTVVNEDAAIDFVRAWNKQQPTTETYATYRVPERAPAVKPEPAQRGLTNLSNPPLTLQTSGNLPEVSTWFPSADPRQNSDEGSDLQPVGKLPVGTTSGNLPEVSDVIDCDITPEELEQRKLEIQRGWTPKERRRRQVWKPARHREVTVGCHQLRVWGLV